MDHGIEALPGEQCRQRSGVAHIHAMRVGRLPGQARQSFQHRRCAVAEVVGDDHPMPALGQCHAGMTSDVTGTAADQNAHRNDVDREIVMC